MGKTNSRGVLAAYLGLYPENRCTRSISLGRGWSWEYKVREAYNTLVKVIVGKQVGVQNVHHNEAHRH